MPSPPLITIAQAATAELIEKKSRFIGQAFPVQTEQEAQQHLADIRARHRDARHNVYAWIIGQDNRFMRSSDDGEPAGTGGRPVLEAIKKSGLRDVAVIVTRYFGGILLGAGGLTRTYGKAAQTVLEAATKIERMPAGKYALSMEYSLLGKVEPFLQQSHITIVEKVFADKVCLICAINNEAAKQVKAGLLELSNATIRIDDLGEQILIDRQL